MRMRLSLLLSLQLRCCCSCACCLCCSWSRLLSPRDCHCRRVLIPPRRVRVRSQCILFHKLLHMSVTSRHALPAGVLSGLASVDADHLMMFVWGGLQDMWAAPTTIVIAVAMLVFLLGWPALVRKRRWAGC